MAANLHQHMMIDSPHLQLMKPAKYTKGVAMNLAIKGPVPAISTKVQMSPEEQRIVHTKLVCLSRRISNINATKFMKGTYQLVPTMLKLNGNHKWGYSLTVGEGMPVAETQRPHLAAIVPNPLDCETFYTCPKGACAKKMHASHPNFDFCNIAKRSKCQHCDGNSAAGQWTCECGRHWFLCKQHAREKNAKIHKRNSPASSGLQNNKEAKTERQHGVQTHEQLLAGDISKATREAKRKAEPQVMGTSDDPAQVAKRIKFGPKIAQRFCLHSRSSALPS